MAVTPSPFGPKPAFFDAAGAPDLSCKLFFYAAGSNTKQNTYTDSTGVTANANPIILNSLGQPTNEIWFTVGQYYKVVLAPSTDTDPPSSPIWTIDNLQGMGTTTTTTTQDEWVAFAGAPTFLSTTTFSVTGNQTATFQTNRRIKTTNTAGTIYSRVVSSAFGAATTVTVENDSGVLDSGISAVSYGLLSATNPSVPETSGGKLFRTAAWTPTYGQCRLAKSGANLVLSRLDGTALTINGVNYVIPSAGVTLAPTALSATTLYRVYAFMSGTTMTLEASTTAHATDTTTGVEIKTGDATRTFVGLAYVEGAATFTDTSAKRYVASYFNRRDVVCQAAFTSSRNTASATLGELNSEIRNNFVTFADEGVTSMSSSSVTVTGAAGTQANTQLAIDSTTVGTGAIVIYNRDTNSNIGPLAVNAPFGALSEGFHFVTIMGATSATSSSWASGSTLCTTLRI